MQHAILFAMLVCASGPAGASASSFTTPPAGSERLVWLPGGLPTGMAGVHRLMAGHAGVRSGLTFALEGGFSRAESFLLPGDTLTEAMFNGAVLWTLNDYFEVGLSGLGTFVADSYFSGASALEIFPGLNAKANIGVFGGWGVAAAFNVFIPSVGGVHGALSPGDSAFTFTGAASKLIMPRLEFTGNVGFVLDRVRYATTEAINPAQRYSSAVVRSNRITLGAAVSSLLAPVWHGVTPAPYIEVTGEIAPGASFGDNPFRATLGTKVYTDTHHTLEVDAGVDVRLWGAPNAPASPYPGIVPWGIFAVVSWHSSLASLRFGETEYIVVNGNQVVPATVIISGRVQDTNAQVLTDASITVDEGRKAFLTVDPNTGHYETLPILAVDGNVIVECAAPGYIAQKRVVSVQARQSSVVVDFHLDPKAPNATLRGLVYNAKDGTGIGGAKIFLSGTTESTFQADEHGAFVISVRPGQYDVYVSAPGFQTNKYPTRIPDNTEVVMHAGLYANEGSAH